MTRTRYTKHTNQKVKRETKTSKHGEMQMFGFGRRWCSFRLYLHHLSPQASSNSKVSVFFFYYWIKHLLQLNCFFLFYVFAEEVFGGNAVKMVLLKLMVSVLCQFLLLDSKFSLFLNEPFIFALN